MDRFSLEQRFEILKTYFECGSVISETLRKLRTKFGRNAAPTARAIRKLMHKVRETGMLVDARRVPYTRPVRTAEAIAAVTESVRQNPGTSTRRRSQQVGIPRTTLRRILHKDLGMFAYKIQLVQELKPNDLPQRLRFAEWALNELNDDPNFARKIIFSDEAHFHLGGYVNKQNCRIWGTDNPHVVVQKPMHPARVTVWCGFWSGGVIGPFFFENAEGRAVNIDGERYRDMITDFLWQELEDIDLDELWFQQDGATCHTAARSINLLRTRFNNRVISRFGDVHWPARSCDLTPLDFFLWGTLKSKVYADNLQTIDHLKQNIRTEIAQIDQETVNKVLENWCSRMAYCRASRGQHFNEIIFHS